MPELLLCSIMLLKVLRVHFDFTMRGKLKSVYVLVQMIRMISLYEICVGPFDDLSVSASSGSCRHVTAGSSYFIMFSINKNGVLTL